MSQPLLRRLRLWNQARLQAARHRRAQRHGEGQDYLEWVRLHDTIDEDQRAHLRQRAGQLDAGPLLSILMPVHDPRPDWLDEALHSVRNQAYGRWELCIADDCSTDPRVREVLARHESQDARIRIAWRRSNGHICAATNSALALARGDYVALLDHDDRLPEHALLCVAETIVHFPDAAVLYSDEDKLDHDGQRCAPNFKCDFNLELFRAQNLLSHFGVYRTDLVRGVGGFRIGFEGAQDYDLAMRCIEAVGAERVVHIPHVLYHWRMHPDSTASGGAAKPYAHLAGRRALEEHLARSGIAGDVTSESTGWYHCDYRLPSPSPTVLIVVTDATGSRAIQSRVERLRHGTAYPSFEVVAASARDGLTLPDACNHAIAERPADVVALVDSRCRFQAGDWLRKLVARACLPGAGAVGAKLLSPRRRIIGNGLLVGAGDAFVPVGADVPAHRGGYCGRARLAQHVGALGEGCVVVRRAHLQHVGWLDPTFRDMGAALADLTLRFNAYGLRNHWVPGVEAVMAPKGRRARCVAADEAKRVAERWRLAQRRDPNYNDNLGRLGGRFGYALPPRVSLAQPWFKTLDL